MSADPSNRFSDRAASYDLGRPTYPVGVIDLLREEIGLEGRWEVADIGSGTGILTRLLLDHVSSVHAVEPNAAMRRIAEEALSTHNGFESVEARAEDTGLPDGSVDLVTAGQAAHWFDMGKARAEFGRILRPPGWTLLVWNRRLGGPEPFLLEVEAFLREWGTDYLEVRTRWNSTEALGTLFGEGYRTETLPNPHEMDAEGLRARMTSSSYMPSAGHPTYDAMLTALSDLFGKYQSGGKVTLNYETDVYWGRLG